VEVRPAGAALELVLPRDREARLPDLIAPGRLVVYSESALRNPAGTGSKAEAEALMRPGDTLLADGRRFYAVPTTASAIGSENVADAHADGTTITVELDERGQRGFGLVTRRVAQDGALRGRSSALVIAVDHRLLTKATIDFNDYPNGIDGRNGFQILMEDADPAVLAAQLMTPLPPLRVAPAPGDG
jgi:hypothetical protein